MTAEYTFNNSSTNEPLRLRAVEKLWDPFTADAFEQIGVRRGWHCLEVGAGKGSVARWLADRVGAEGRVLATDIELTLLAEVVGPANLEVLRHNIARESLPADSFDVVHARLVLEHLVDRDQALENMVRAAKPGGWVVVEDTDWASLGSVTARAEFDGLVERIVQFLNAAGHDAYCGRTLKSKLAGHGLVDIELRTQVEYLESDSPGMDVLRLTLAELEPRLIAAGVLTRKHSRELRTILDAPDFAALSYIMCSASGRKRPD